MKERRKGKRRSRGWRRKEELREEELLGVAVSRSYHKFPLMRHDGNHGSCCNP